MELIKNKVKITQLLKLSFDVEQQGLYALFISARCKSEKQLGLSDDEDLIVEIDGRKFREIPEKEKPRYKNIPVAFSGGSLHNLKKKIIFFIYFQKGRHFLNIIPDKEPLGGLVEEIKLELLSQPAQIPLSKINLELNEIAEDGNRRPWITFALIDLPLGEIKTKITTKRRFLDSDDVKIIIDGEIKRNLQNIFRKFWFWLGTFLKGKSQINSFKTNFPSGIHYIEFWADRMPTLHWIEFDLGEVILGEKAKVVWEKANLREEAKIDENILAEISRGEEVIVVERAIKGDRPFYRPGEPAISNRWHKVFHQGKIGVIFSESLEIKGEGEKDIEQKIKEKAKELNLDFQISLSLAKCESKLFPYAESKDGAKGLYQLMPDTIEDINKNRGGDIDDPFNIDQNIDGGLRYFRWVRSLYKGVNDELRKTIAAYNAGPGRVKKDEPLELEKYEEQTQILVNCVLGKIKGSFKNIFGIIGSGVVLLLLIFFSGYLIGNQFFLSKFQKSETEIENEFIFEQPENLKSILVDDLDPKGIEGIEKIVFLSYRKEPFIYQTDIYFVDENSNYILESDLPQVQTTGYFKKAWTQDLNGDSKKELLVEVIEGKLGCTRLYSYQKEFVSSNGGWRTILDYIPVLVEGEEKIPEGLCSSFDPEFKDLDGDGILEIILSYQNYPPGGLNPRAFFRWDGKNYVKYKEEI